ncbi:hypothetical protein [Leptospira dzoumogneensis]|uniref:Uncharacterized protein n=1 Tax=Leptospira dzoumogneensis TaxID=2484904 RepID=A0A4Z1AXM3_9LEPT|nr:hypothetical protein [Leptospira dzoumogneensis]TGN02870.1 hypothetical protein EHR06_02350 [Leptospira dzoumogneensis]
MISDDPNSGILVLRLIDNSEDKEWSQIKIRTGCFQETYNEDILENECLGEELFSQASIGIENRLEFKIRPGKYSGRIVIQEETFFSGKTVISIGLFNEKFTPQKNCDYLSKKINGITADISQCPNIIIQSGKRTIIDLIVTNEKESYFWRAFWSGFFSRGLSAGSRQFSINHSKFIMLNE